MILKQGLVIFISLFLSSCVGSLWTGATMVYDRHHVYQKLDDYHLSLKVSHAINLHKNFKSSECLIDLAVLNGDVLLAGHVPTIEIKEELRQRLALVKGYRRMFYQIEVSRVESNVLLDSWITTKIRSQILADSSIDPK